MATITATVTTRIVSTVTASSSTATSTKVAAQAGILEGANPVDYNASNPILLFIVQAAIIIIFCRILHYPLRYLGQPRVIAEIIGGILLGPSVMMRIPGFKDSIFPTASIPVLSNVANLGLILFLFLTGLEVDLRLFRRNWKVAVSVAIASMALPFGLGYAIAWGLYNQFGHEEGLTNIEFGIFGLFIGTALAITAFPVLCRILSELNLLNNIVGVTVLAAGVGNDVVGWILLALCVALVNNSSGLAALWALLCTIGWALFLIFGVRPCFIWLLRRNGSLHNGPTEGMVVVTLLMVLTSAWFTGVIGVHPIFGGFLVGIICPHEGGFTIKLTEKIEDFLSALFLPLYFALSGLSTNLGLLNDGITWAYVVGVIAVAFSGKIIGGTLAARLTNMFWRESFSIGVLMSCKGLVELIVLNIGYSAKILSQRTFTIFVVMALVTTVATTPLTKVLYPLWYQQKVEKFRRGEIDWDGNSTGSGPSSEQESFDKLNQSQVRKVLVYLRLDSLPGLFTFISLLGGADAATAHSGTGSAADSAPNTAADEATSQAGGSEGSPSQSQSQAPVIRRRHLEVHGIRLLELTERTSSVMQVTEADELARHDPVVNSFRTFSQLHDVAVSGQVAVVPTSAFNETLVSEANETSSDFVLIPWGEKGLVTEDQSIALPSASSVNRFDDHTHLAFVNTALERAVCNTGIFIDNGFGSGGGSSSRRGRPALSRTLSALSTRSLREPATLPVLNKNHRIFFPFFGGVDDRVALRFVIQLAKNKTVTATIARISSGGDETSHAPEIDDGSIAHDDPKLAVQQKTTAVEDEPSAHDLGLLSMLQSSLPESLSGRVNFVDYTVTGSATKVLDEMMVRAGSVVGQPPKNAGDIIVVGRRHARFGDSSIASGEGSSSSYDLGKTIGAAGTRVVNGNLKASVLIVQAGGRGLEW